MVKQREGYRQVFSPKALERMRKDCCPSCGKPKKRWDRRTDWRCCSVKCTKVFWEHHCIADGWADLRKKVFERDDWRCVKCGHQPVKQVRHGYHPVDAKILKSEYLQDWNGWVNTIVDTLIADHIKPIALGGDEWDMDNIQTLCVSCNKAKTARDIRKISWLRNAEKVLAKGQRRLV